MAGDERTLCWVLRWVFPLVGAGAELAVVAGVLGLDGLLPSGPGRWGPLPLCAVLIVSTTLLHAALGTLVSRHVMRLAVSATRDALTQLWNRPAALAALEQGLRRSERRREPLAVLMLDVDHFKAFNDSRGHAQGDEVLRLVGRCLRTSVRRSDVAARLGGDEFLVIASCSPSDALMLAQRIRVRLSSLVLEHGDDFSERPTVSVGVAAWLPDIGAALVPADLLGAADRALYASKQAGRDRATLFEDADALARPQLPTPAASAGAQSAARWPSMTALVAQKN